MPMAMKTNGKETISLFLLYRMGFMPSNPHLSS